MRDVPDSMTAAWRSGDFTGRQRPVVRATVTHNFMKLWNFTLISTYSRMTVAGSGIPAINQSGGIDPLHGEKIAQTYADFLWHNLDAATNTPKELPNIQSVTWTRSTDGQVAEGTIVIQNVAQLATGHAPLAGEFELPGYYHPYYGSTSYASRWGHSQNSWFGMLMPDNIIRTFEGYGTDGSGVAPEKDTHLVETGVWMIDTVTPSAAALTMEIKVRDVGRLLLEQMVYTPVTPTQFYPLTFQNWDQTVWIGGTQVQKGRLKVDPTHSSIEAWGVSQVGGHTLADAFSGSGSKFWLSIGNMRPSAGYSYEWVEGDVSGNVSEVRFTTKKSGYVAYLSLMVNGSWIGSHSINYVPGSVGRNGSDIAYYKSMVVKSESQQKFSFTAVKGVTAFRLTFTNLQYFPDMGPYHYRAGVRDVQVYGEAVVNTTRAVPLTPGPAGSNPARCQDFTEIVKLAAAWAGFYWSPDGARILSDGTIMHLTPADSAADALGPGVTGALWGDFQDSGAAPVLPIDPSNFDKKSLMDVITYVQNFLGFFFCIDESGAVQWRLPNLFNLGNYRSGLSAEPGYTTDMIVIDETTTLRGLTSAIDSGNVREGIWVGNTAGTYAVIRPGWNPNPTGMRRLSGWCVDTETEIFTKRGWQSWSGVRAGDETLSINEETGESFWNEIRSVEVFEEATRTMVAFEGRRFSALATPNHKWLVETLNTRSGERRFQWRTTETLSSMDRVPLTLPRADTPADKTLSDALVEVVAWTYTEGAFKEVGSKHAIVLYQDNRVNPEKCDQIHAAMTNAFPSRGDWSYRERRGHSSEWYLGVTATETILKHVDLEMKAPTMEFLLSLTEDQLHLFIETSISADGYRRRERDGSTNKDQDFFFQNNGPRLDAFLAACALAGVATRTTDRGVRPGSLGNHPHSTVTIMKHSFAKPRTQSKALKYVEHDGKIWCPAMYQSHTWLARRRGTVYFTGNTDYQFTSMEECRMAADLIALRQLMEYWKDTLVVHANPAIQIDDQIRIFERSTSEGWVHYVRSIQSTHNVATGEWIYTIETNWLGQDPDSRWTFAQEQLGDEARALVQGALSNPYTPDVRGA